MHYDGPSVFRNPSHRKLVLQDSQTQVMVQLSNDIWMLILDYITVTSDLQSLCLTSRNLRVLATPRLYDTVHIRLWDHRQVETILGSLKIGAVTSFDDTRTVIFEDEGPPREPSCIMAGSLAFLGGVARVQTPITERDQKLESILRIFPKDKLLSYRFIANRGLSDGAIELLGVHRRLANVQCTVGSDVYGFAHRLLCKTNLRSLDLQFVEPQALGEIVKGLHSVSDTLERLCLGQVNHKLGRSQFSNALARAIGMHGHRTGYLSMLPRLTELALLELDLSTLFQHIRALVDITKLLRLTIFHCQGVTNFLSDIETQVGGKSVALQHFSIESPQEVAESIKQRSLDAAEKCLQAMIHAETLQSLHTSWNVHSLLDPAFAEAFPTSQHMRSLSIHEGTNDSEYEHEMVLDISHLRETFQACPKLRSFGVRIPERFLLHQEPGEHSIMYDEFMEALQDLPHLRVLHLRQRNYLCSGLPTPAEDNPRNRLALTFKTHRWANVFFEHLHSRKWSLKLTALVIRCYLEKNANASNGYTYSSQHCFVKGLQVDAYGRTAAVAVPISRATLRKIEPDSDILDFDPECHWIGGRIGRLNRF